MSVEACFFMAKFLLFSDIHVHPHKQKTERLQDCLKALNWCFEVAEENAVDAVLFGGDLLHERQKLDSMTYVEVFKILDKWKNKNRPVYLLVGNHDMWFANAWTISSIYPFRAIENYHVVDQTQSINIAGVEWHFMPYTHNPIEELEKLPKSKVSKSYFLGHLAIDGAKLNSAGSISDVAIEHDGDMVKVEADFFKKYKRSFFGHYHGAQKLAKNVEYIGSPLQLSFGEANETKHVIILDSENDSVEYVENNFSPKHFYLNENNYREFDQTALENSYVDFSISDSSDIELKKQLEKFTEDTKVANLRIRCEPKKIQEHVISDVKKIISDEASLLSNYLKQEENTDLDKDILLEIGNKIIAFAQNEEGQ